ADHGGAGRAAAEGGVVSAAVDPDTLLEARPTVGTALAAGVAALREAGIDTAVVDAEWLLASVLRVPRGALAIERRRALEPAEAGRYVARLRRRLNREPLQHVLGTAPCAAAMARDNVAALGLAGRVTVEVSDLFGALGTIRADIVVSNPPYLPTELIPTLSPEVSRHDPRIAMDGGPEGLTVIR